MGHKELTSSEETHRSNILARIGVLFLILTAVAVIWLSNLYFTNLFKSSTRANAERQLALYSGRIVSDLQRSAIVPLLLSRDTTLISALNSADYTNSSQRLISYHDDIGTKEVFLLDKTGRTVASSNRNNLGEFLSDKPVYVAALRSNVTVFTNFENNNGGQSYYFSRRLLSDKEIVGIIVVEVGLGGLFDTWRKNDATLIVTDSEGTILLSTERQF
ncbi:MAG: sensor histidine kinase, partial [Amylibacter sp.]